MLIGEAPKKRSYVRRPAKVVRRVSKGPRARVDQEKSKAMVAAVQNGASVAQVSRDMGVSRQTIYSHMDQARKLLDAAKRAATPVPAAA